MRINSVYIVYTSIGVVWISITTTGILFVHTHVKRVLEKKTYGPAGDNDYGLPECCLYIPLSQTSFRETHLAKTDYSSGDKITLIVRAR